MHKLFFPIIFIALTFQLLAEQQPSSTSLLKLNALKVEEKITIDGVLSESIWKNPGFTDLKQQDPNQGEVPSQKSEVWFAYDNDAIYFAGKFYDTHPDSIFTRLVRRDFVWGDPSDGALIYIDSYRDKRNGYFFYVSAAGTLADGLLENDEKQTDISWDAVWEGVSHIDNDGWSVEMRIPYSQLRFKDVDEQEWGVNVERFISRKVETDMIAYTPRNESGFASRFPALIGIKGIKPSGRFELLPYMTGKAEYKKSDINDPFNKSKQYSPNLGLDVRAGLGNSFTLNATINPDFGQVEVDPAVVNLSDVETSFQEKRPFFTEGVNIFRFGNGGINNNVNFNWNNPSLFYSRRIGRAPQGDIPSNDYSQIPNGTHILGAGKISGSIDQWKVGTIHALTRREYAKIDIGGLRSEYQVEPLSYYGVLRAQRDFNNGAQGLGILSTFTDRFFNDDNLSKNLNNNAFVAALDGWTALDGEKNFVISGWGAVSRVAGSSDRMIALQRNSGHYFQRPDVSYLGVDSSASSLTGYAGRILLNQNNGRFTVNSSIGFISPKFEPNDLGYNSYSDVINSHIFFNYRWNTPTDFYRQAGISTGAFLNYDFGGNKTGQGYYFGSYINLLNLYGGQVNLIYTPETYNARRTRGGPLTLNPKNVNVNLNLYTDNRVWWVGSFNGSFSSGADGRSRYFSPYLEFKVTPTLTVAAGPSYSKDISEAQWITSFNDPSAENTYSRRYVFAHLDQTTFAADIRADWIISPRLSFQIYIQPLISSGTYTDIKALRKSRSFDFIKYGEEGSTLVKNVSAEGNISYTIDADGNGPSAPRTIDNPDFNFISLRGNAVLRWEYLPGSTLYFVWTQSREGIDPDGNFHFGRSVNDLVSIKPDNIFMIKATYWLGM